MKVALVVVLAAILGTGNTQRADRPVAETSAFHGRAERIDAATRERMSGVSWRRGCPVGFEQLRLLTVSHWGFDGGIHRGRLVVNRDAATATLSAMRTLFRLHYPIRQMRLVDAYGADDHRSMAADNTSAFNCRFVAGSGGVWSEHAYGRALDLNPLENPYVTESGYVSPPAGAPYADRSRRAQGLIHRGGPVVAAFAAVGWEWGGNWPWPRDYQHFSATGS
jgi:poly-gamma-glutamate synthesis protein (capsule biosynthesis protein)